MFEEVYDIIVIGTGFAGLAAAIEASKSGCSVLVIDKMKIPGGNSAISGGMIAVANSPVQAKQNIADSPSKLANDMIKAGLGINYPDLVQTVSEQSRNAFIWMRDYLGVTFQDTVLQGGGHSVARICSTNSISGGASIIQAMLVKCRELGIPVRLQCAMKSLVRNESGRVIGLTVSNNYIFPALDSGTIQNIKARKAVILACGGFCQDVAFRMTQDPRLTGDFETTNHPGATAEGLVTALKAGATPVHLSWIQLGPWTSRDEKGWGVGAMFSLLVGYPCGIMVDTATGKRFINELTDRLSRTQHMTIEGRIPILIVGEEAALEYPYLRQCLKRKVVKKFDTIEAMATDHFTDSA